MPTNDTDHEHDDRAQFVNDLKARAGVDVDFSRDGFRTVFARIDYSRFHGNGADILADADRLGYDTSKKIDGADFAIYRFDL